MSLDHKIDFAVIFTVNCANPNGDPLNGNRPRQDMNGYGEITDVCLKRKLRDRLLEDGQSIFVQSDERKIDHKKSLRDRAECSEFGVGADTFNSKKTSHEQATQAVCKKWYDVRAFGQVFAYKGLGKEGGVSLPIRGPVTLQSAFSLQPININSTQITKSVSGEGDGSKKGSDTMGTKHRVDDATYVTYGAITPQLAEKTGFDQQDAQTLKDTLPKLFEGDASSARPEGSMRIKSIIWWQHNSRAGQYSSAKVHQTLRDHLAADQPTDLASLNASLQQKLPELVPEVIEGF